MERLSGIGDPRLPADSPPDRFDIRRPRAGFGAAQFLDQCGIVALGLGDVAWVQIVQRLSGRWRERQGCGCEHREFFRHLSHPFIVPLPN